MRVACEDNAYQSRYLRTFAGQPVAKGVKAYLPKSSLTTRLVSVGVCVTSSVKWLGVKSQGPHTRDVRGRTRREGTRVSLGAFSCPLPRLAPREEHYYPLAITVNGKNLRGLGGTAQ